MAYFTYIMASRPLGAIYIGSTNNLALRVEQHRSGQGAAHTAKYKINRLVWFEVHETYPDAALREQRIKRWRRKWKDDLIMSDNPQWQDISWRIPK